MATGEILLFFVKRYPKILIDAEDLAALGFCHAHFSTKGYVRINYKGKLEYLHRVIMELPEGLVDHEDRNILNCKRLNLRIATRQQNANNSEGHADRKLSSKGTVYYPERNKYAAYICVNNKRTFLGYFDTEQQAATRYNEAAPFYQSLGI